MDSKAMMGVRDIVRNNGGTWQYNSAATITDAWDVSTGLAANNLKVRIV